MDYKKYNTKMNLNLPQRHFNIKTDNNGNRLIFDKLRRRFVSLTPEEWVRQNFVEFLIQDKGFPKGLMCNEVSLTQNGISRRCDTIVTDRFGNPAVIVEYKAPHIKITQCVFDQICRYNISVATLITMLIPILFLTIFLATTTCSRLRNVSLLQNK